MDQQVQYSTVAARLRHNRLNYATSLSIQPTADTRNQLSPLGL